MLIKYKCSVFSLKTLGYYFFENCFFLFLECFYATQNGTFPFLHYSQRYRGEIFSRFSPVLQPLLEVADGAGLAPGKPGNYSVLLEQTVSHIYGK